MGNKDISSKDPMEINMDNLKGQIVGLSPREVFWKPMSGNTTLELSRISGRISCKVGSVSEFDGIAIIKGLRSGRLLLMDKVIKSEPSDPVNSHVMDTTHIEALRLLDITDKDLFTETMEVQSSKILEACLEMEKRGSNRDKYISIIKQNLR